MLNEKRVKHMVELAMYENKDGAEEMKTSSYYKKDYISFNMLWSIIWMTIAYLIVAILFVVAKLQVILNELSLIMIIAMGGGIIGAYIVLLVVYIFVSRDFYKRKHARSYFRVKKFKEGLEILQDMYQEEKTNG